MLSMQMVGEAGLDRAEKQARGCARPVRLKGSTTLVNRATGEAKERYSSGHELDGHTYVRCGNRRKCECESCSDEYKDDAWHKVVSGLMGGKGVPASVAEHPMTFATLTAPSFGVVHGRRDKGPCRARRDKPMCRHGRPLWCNKRHEHGDSILGMPLCAECYDYVGHVVWQWKAPELWRRFTIALQRSLAKRVGLSVAAFRTECRIAFSKVAEFQARGLVHFHAPIRLDGPEGPDGDPCGLGLTTTDLEDAVCEATAAVQLDVAVPGEPVVYRLRWGAQVDCRSITGAADREALSGSAHPEQVAGYLAKYLTKSTEEFGIPSRVTSAESARLAGANPHAVRIVETAMNLAGAGDEFERLAKCLRSLGYRGHPITSSRRYSVTFTHLRGARRVFRKNPGLDPDADIRELLDDDLDVPKGFDLVSSWEYVGRGYLDLDASARAVMSATLSRTREADRAAAASR